MAASGGLHGPGYNPPTIPRVILEPTARGIQAFKISFEAMLPYNLALTLKAALDADPPDIEPLEPDVRALHHHIHRALVVCMPPNDPDLLLDMVAGSGTMGPANIVWLSRKLDPKHVGGQVKTMLDVVGGSLGADIFAQVAAAKIMLKKARSLDGEFALNDTLLAVFLIFKLPQHSALRQRLIQKDPLDTPEAILLELESLAAFDHNTPDDYSSPGGAAAFSSIRKKTCYNCDSDDHEGRECDQPKSNCSICGLAAGHLDKHCLAQCDRAISDSLPAAAKAKILERRKLFKASRGSATSVMMQDVPTLEQEAELLAWLEENPDADVGNELAPGVGAACIDCE